MFLCAVLAGALLGPAGAARAAQTPAPGAEDHRVRSVNYSDRQVYTVTGFYGYAVTMIFEEGEAIGDVVLGDPDGWDVKAVRNVLTLKPRAMEPDTSMVVLTNSRTYVFDVRTKSPRRTAQGQALDKDQAFLIRFDYPEQLAREQAKQAQEAAARQRRERVELASLEDERQVAAALPPRALNRAYEYSGGRELAPTEAWDDGRFTYMKFSAEQGIPAVYTVAAEGLEVIAPKHFEADVMVVQRTARRFILRRGALVTCVWNTGAERVTEHDANGASDPLGARLLRRTSR